ncbi:MAG: entericidin EcnA/B family protein [Paracoccaceae bacterium]|nr:entericidin EcnA/B family protein [Seohaeicola saemankumensis]MCD1626910.1 entericidin EcnA/B family protein [Seohaeicola saemankumensis]
MNKLTVIMLGLGCLAVLAGCATVEGVGQDISGGARTVRSWF